MILIFISSFVALNSDKHKPQSTVPEKVAVIGGRSFVAQYVLLIKKSHYAHEAGL